MKLREYLEKAYQERMEGSPTPIGSSKELASGKGQANAVSTTYDLELAGRIVKGTINGNPVNISIDDFSRQFPEIAKGVLETLKAQGAARYTPDKQPPADFVQNPQTKGKMVATPDV